jgi:uncharacterized membrane protein
MTGEKLLKELRAFIEKQKMKQTKNKLLSGILIFGLITSLLVLFDIQYFYLRAILSFIFLITIPGLLIMLKLKIREIGFWEYLVYTIGLSIAFLMFGGLFINYALPLVGIGKPLSLILILISLNAFLLVFWIIAYKRNKEILFEIRLPKLDWLNKIFFITPVIFPLLSILGAIILNNGGPNYLTMLLLGGIAAYVFTIVLFRKKLNENIYPWAILMLSISLLLMYSLRSWHILGWDINQEYLVFALTNSAKYWSKYASVSAYNSCISITILPTIFASFTKINNEYIYKLIFPILFSIVPLMIYLSTKKFLSEGFAFLTSFFCISQPWFIAQMLALARQEIAFIFLALILLLIFNHELNESIKAFLYIIIGMSIILSHYSTTYVWLATMVIFYILGRLLKIIFLKNLKLFFSFKYILLMILVTFLWQFQLNIPPNNLGGVLSNTIYDISNIFSEDSIASGFNRLTFKNLNINNDQNVSNNYLTMTREYKNKALILYPESTYRDYSPRAVFAEKLKSQVPIEISIDVFNLLKVIKIILIVILPIIGILYLFKKHFYKKNKNRDISNLKNSIGNYILISISTLPLIVLFLFLPSVQTEYNLTRMYLQGLLSFSFLTVLGGCYLLYKLRLNKINYFILGLTLILFFLSSTGLVSQLIGGNPLLTLNNFGEEYDNCYTTQLDVKSAEWLANKREGNSMIYADVLAGLRLTSYAYIIDYTFDILPSTIDTRSYVYLSQTNVEKGKVYKIYNIGLLAYDTPIEFLNSNKNLIYNNGGSEVYK